MAVAEVLTQSESFMLPLVAPGVVEQGQAEKIEEEELEQADLFLLTHMDEFMHQQGLTRLLAGRAVDGFPDCRPVVMGEGPSQLPKPRFRF